MKWQWQTGLKGIAIIFLVATILMLQRSHSRLVDSVVKQQEEINSLQLQIGRLQARTSQLVDHDVQMVGWDEVPQGWGSRGCGEADFDRDEP